MFRFVVLVLALLALFESSQGQGYPSALSYYQGAVSGTGTVYSDWAEYSGCGFMNNPDPGYQVFTTVGTSTAYFGQGELCGVCFQVTSVTEETGNPSPYPNPPYVVMLNNNGPTPENYWLDHSFPYPVGGRFGLVYQAVNCPVTSGIQWQINQGSMQWYLQLIPVYSKVAIAQMCIYSGGQWVAMNRVYGGGLWYASGNLGNNPSFKAISVDGQVIVDQIGLDLSNPLGATTIVGGSYPQFNDINPWGGPVPGCDANPTVYQNFAPNGTQSRPPHVSPPPVTPPVSPPIVNQTTTEYPTPGLSRMIYPYGILAAVVCGSVLVLVVALVAVRRRRHQLAQDNIFSYSSINEEDLGSM